MSRVLALNDMSKLPIDKVFLFWYNIGSYSQGID